MNQRVRRVLLAATAAGTLVLAGCSVPGQAGHPADAATWDDYVVTQTRVDDIYEAWLTETEQRDPANRRQILTAELLRPHLLEAMAEAGTPINDATAHEIAVQWLRFQGIAGEPSDELADAAAAAVSMFALASSDPELTALTEIAEAAEAEAIVSPRAGQFSAEVFLESISGALEASSAQDLGPFGYTEFQHVSGLTDVDAPWIVRN